MRKTFYLFTEFILDILFAKKIESGRERERDGERKEVASHRASAPVQQYSSNGNNNIERKKIIISICKIFLSTSPSWDLDISDEDKHAH